MVFFFFFFVFAVAVDQDNGSHIINHKQVKKMTMDMFCVCV